MGIRDEEQHSLFENMRLDDHHCFLCGCDMGEHSTVEHVFPKWLQNKYDLWNKTTELLNETKIEYRNLTIPCCFTCNNEDLSKLEGEIKRAAENGYEAVLALDGLKLYQWAAKLYYGLLRKELTLKYDRSDLNSSNILADTDFKHFEMLHLIMQSIRRPIEFPSGKPFSVLVANMHNPKGLSEFDFRDNLLGHVIKVQLGEVGFIVSFEDAAINEDSYGNYLRAVNGRKLHRLQFDELFARIVYQNSLMDSQLRFFLAIPQDESLPVSINMLGRIDLAEFNQKDLAVYLWEFCKHWFNDNGITWDDVFKPPNLVVSWMSNANRELIFMDENGDKMSEEV